MAETTQPDPAGTPSSTETPIDVVRTTSDDINVLSTDPEPIQDGKQATNKPSPASPKKRYVESVWISQAAYGELQGFGIGYGPSIGLIHGTISSQGAALINRFSVIPRSLRALCQWKVSAAGGTVHTDAIGFIILESCETQFSYDPRSFMQYITAGQEHLLGITVQRFHNEAGHLVIKSNCAVYSSDLSTKLRPINAFKLASCAPLGYINPKSATHAELIEVKNMLTSPISELFEEQSREHSRVANEFFDVNNTTQLDRVLLELRNNINQRVLELERASFSKKQKTSNGEADTSGKEDLAKFRNHIIQLALKEFTPTNETLGKRPIPLTGPDHIPTIFTKPVKSSLPAKPAAASVAKRKPAKPAAPKPAPSTT